jgi:hypothetical protein
MTTWPKTKAFLLLCALLPLAGCLMEDSITITNEGLVSFESTVTEPDESQNMDFAAFEKGTAGLIEELRQHKWTVEREWASKERPYRFKVTGSGQLPDVVGTTALYRLSKLDDTKYEITFLVLENSHVRVVFESPCGWWPWTWGKGTATILDAKEQPVHEIKNASSKDTYTIVLK